MLKKVDDDDDDPRAVVQCFDAVMGFAKREMETDERGRRKK